LEKSKGGSGDVHIQRPVIELIEGFRRFLFSTVPAECTHEAKWGATPMILTSAPVLDRARVNTLSVHQTTLTRVSATETNGASQSSLSVDGNSQTHEHWCIYQLWPKPKRRRQRSLKPCHLLEVAAVKNADDMAGKNQQHPGLPCLRVVNLVLYQMTPSRQEPATASYQQQRPLVCRHKQLQSKERVSAKTHIRRGRCSYIGWSGCSGKP